MIPLTLHVGSFYIKISEEMSVLTVFAAFKLQVVSQCVNPTGSFSNAVYAYGHVVVLVTSQV